MPRYALELEYAGTGLSGWQRQAAGLSVQQVLEAAASRLALAAPVAATAAGRTDAGVHAEAMVVHLDLDRAIAPARLRDALNFHMRTHAVAVLRAAVAAPDWHARFSATGRAYRYRILARPA
ncbi:MAG: tRNA pseudouridine(38-40) synthase TruA, partial [Rhodospirillales bacterium]|nr:tRNA pseudouridine(38-40) synthase TruA [Rhodospirillales bacterium]